MSVMDEEFDFEQETEDELYMEHRRKIIILVMCVVLVVVVGVGSLLAYITQNKEDSRIYEDSAQYNDELLPLFNEKARLEVELADLGPSPAQSASGYATVLFLCEDPGDWIDYEFKAICDMYGVRCIVAVSESLYPGEEGCLSIEELKKLISGGWKLCITAETVTQADNVRAKLEADGFTDPDTVYLTSGTSEDSVDNFAKLGIKYIITNGDEKGETLWTVPAVGYREIGAISRLQSTAETSGCLVYTIGSLDERNQYTVSSLNSMFTTVGGYVSDGKVGVTVDFEKAYIRRVLFEDLVVSKENDYLEKKNEIEKRLNEIEAEILKYQSGNSN